MTDYAELAATTNFSFLRGASHPQEMVAMARALGLAAIGITDRNSFAGVVRAFDEARKQPAIKLLVGTRLVTQDGFETLAYSTDRAAYGRLCRLLTKGNLAAKKGDCLISFDAVLAASEGQMLIALPPDEPNFKADFIERLALLAQEAKGRVFLAGVHRHRGDEPRRLGRLAELGERMGTPLIAINDVFYHAPERRPLLDILTCIREKCTLEEAGFRLTVNAERHLKSPKEMARLFAGFEE
ncbi:MAG: PHP domain-containing protein, partial [Hyphomicrobiales bacterium]|nr:PHP domain-containing protein [Hyphomicrobiales bacterium]